MTAQSILTDDEVTEITQEIVSQTLIETYLSNSGDAEYNLSNDIEKTDLDELIKHISYETKDAMIRKQIPITADAYRAILNQNVEQAVNTCTEQDWDNGAILISGYTSNGISFFADERSANDYADENDDGEQVEHENFLKRDLTITC